jgi:hypothetical protein
MPLSSNLAGPLALSAQALPLGGLLLLLRLARR